jgi:hypothetical protein
MKCHNTFIYGSKMGNEKDVVRLEIESVIFIMKPKLIMKCLMYAFELFDWIYSGLFIFIKIIG